MADEIRGFTFGTRGPSNGMKGRRGKRREEKVGKGKENELLICLF